MLKQTNIAHDLESVRFALNGVSPRMGRSAIGQFFTPAPIACFMAGMFQKSAGHVRILDPGAGMGTLFAALVQELAMRDEKPESITVVAYETDERMRPHIGETFRLCGETCRRRGVQFFGDARFEDFVQAAAALSEGNLFRAREPLFTHAILNPPYKKINGDSSVRRTLGAAGMETSNLYSAFVWLSAKMLAPGGELAAITPRSFCNGPYFRPFRKSFLDLMGLRRFHVFQSRSAAFKDDEVLQENVMFHAVRGGEHSPAITVSVSAGNNFSNVRTREIPLAQVILPGDRDTFIHLPEEEDSQAVMAQMAVFDIGLAGLGLEVSTGRVVDFRVRDFLRMNPETGTVPLVYPCHFDNGFVRWPLEKSKKPNALLLADETRGQVVDTGHYVLVKRFSAKEEPRRIVAAVFDPSRVAAGRIGFENHLNYFHDHGKGMSGKLAKGLALYLNSTLVDRHFRLFSGHTQVNATDLRRMGYPTRDQLVRLGEHVGGRMPGQCVVDEIIQRELFGDD